MSEITPLNSGLMRPESIAAIGGEPETIGANRPVNLSGRCGLLVATGTVDLFLQQEAGGKVGRRNLLCSISGGQLAWAAGGFAPPEGWRVLAVGHSGTRVVIVESPDQWARVDSASLAQAVEVFLDAVASSEVFTAQGGTGEGDATADVGLEGPGESVAAAWFEQAAETLTRLLAGAASAIVEAQQQDALRLADSPKETARRLSSSLTALADVVDRPVDFPLSSDQLVQLEVALARIARAFGSETSAIHVDHGQHDPVGTLVQASGCQSRVITLRGKWWTETGGAILGFLGTEQKPVALLPGRRGYRMFDPETAETSRITGELAGQFQPTAYMIYPPLPVGAKSAFALVKSGMGLARGDLFWLMIMGVLAGLTALVIPYATGLFYGAVLPTGDYSLLAALLALLLGATVVSALVGLSQNILAMRIQGMLSVTLQPGLMDHVMNLPSPFFRRYSTGDLANRISGLEAISRIISGPAIAAIMSFIFSIFSVVMMFFYSPTLGTITAVTLLIIALFLLSLIKRQVSIQQRSLETGGEVSSLLYQGILAVQKLRVAGAEGRFLARWAALFRDQMGTNYRAGRTQALITATTAAVPACIALMLFLVAGTIAFSAMTASSFIAVFTAAGQFTGALVGLSMSMGALLNVVPLWNRLMPILDQEVEHVGDRSPGRLSGQVSAVALRFSYDPEAPPVLDDVSLEAKPGEFIAITGPSGSGKSTVLRMLLGLDLPEQGSVHYDGIELSLIDVRAVRRQCGIVMQGAQPLPGELLSAIVGSTGATEQDAWRAAEAAGLAADIEIMPMRMHTIVGEGGMTFSGGQMQRLMIAKALVAKPQILFFDEATSALDDRTQAHVVRSLQEAGSTCIFVAHRLSTIRHADRIYVLENGRVCQSGTFEELVAVPGVFAELARRQQLAETA